MARDAHLKLVHTRLDSRTYRPGTELCMDQVCVRGCIRM